MRTREILEWGLTITVLGGGVALLDGCAAQAQRMAMQQAAAPAPAQFLGQVAIADVTGGKSITLTSALAEVGNDALREALRLSLQQARYLSSTPDAAQIVLRAGVVDVEKSSDGVFDAKVITIIRYVLANKDGGETLFDELITTSCTRSFSDDVLGATRLQHAEECAVRKSIASFLAELSASALK